MIIDAHNHPDWWGHNRKKMLLNMDRFGIHQTWLLTVEHPRDEMSDSDPRAMPPGACQTGDGTVPLWRCVSYAEKNPERFVLGYCPDPRRPEALDWFESAIDTYGVQVCGECKFRMMYDSPDALDLFRLSGKYVLPVVLHFQTPIDLGRSYPRRHIWYGGDLDTLERVLQKCPDTQFLGHAQAFWAGISNDALGATQQYPDAPVQPGGRVSELLRRYPNLFCDLSAGSGYHALYRDPGFAKEFLDEFQDRVLYARDLFSNQHQTLLNSLELSSEILKKLYYKNALRLLSAGKQTQRNA